MYYGNNKFYNEVYYMCLEELLISLIRDTLSDKLYVNFFVFTSSLSNRSVGVGRFVDWFKEYVARNNATSISAGDWNTKLIWFNRSAQRMLQRLVRFFQKYQKPKLVYCTFN